MCNVTRVIFLFFRGGIPGGNMTILDPSCIYPQSVGQLKFQGITGEANIFRWLPTLPDRQ